MPPKIPNFANRKMDCPTKRLPVLKNGFKADWKEIKLTILEPTITDISVP